MKPQPNQSQAPISSRERAVNAPVAIPSSRATGAPRDLALEGCRRLIESVRDRKAPKGMSLHLANQVERTILELRNEVDRRVRVTNVKLKAVKS